MENVNFENIQVGDRLLKRATRYHDDEIVMVTKVMKSQFVVDSGIKVWKKNGCEVCGTLEYRYPTQEDIDRIADRNLRKTLLDQIQVRLFNYGSSAAYSTSVLKTIVDLLDEDIKTH